MAEINEHIQIVNSKLQILLKQFVVLQTENTQLKKTIEADKLANLENKETIEALKQEQLIMKASLDKMDEGEKKELEKKINGYLKNIDKCIALLSHKNNT